MSTTLILRGVYDLTGAALVITGQPAVCTLLLTMANPLGYGPDVPQDLTGRAFVQRVVDGTNAVLASAAGVVIGAGTLEFTLSAATVAALLPDGEGAIDLTHMLVELTTGGDDDILIRPFAIRTPTAGAQVASFILNTDTSGSSLIVRYAGAPGAQGASSGGGGSGTGDSPMIPATPRKTYVGSGAPQSIAADVPAGATKAIVQFQGADGYWSDDPAHPPTAGSGMFLAAFAERLFDGDLSTLELIPAALPCTIVVSFYQ
jgi:hypothetical protein